MANQKLFGAARPPLQVAPPSNTTNMEGAVAFKYDRWHELCQLAFTGTFPDGTYYDSNAGMTQLTRLIQMADEVGDPVRLGKLAIASRHDGKMKDMPQALCLILSRPGQRERELETKTDKSLEEKLELRTISNARAHIFRVVFDKVVDDAKVLKTWFQMLRSGAFGRKSLSYAMQRAVQDFLNNRGEGALLSGSIGGKNAKEDETGTKVRPISLRDVFRCARPTPKDNSRRAFFGWLTDKPTEKWAPATMSDLPRVVHLLEAYRRTTIADEQIQLLRQMEGTYVRWDLLSGDARNKEVWKEIALRMMGPFALRANLSTLQRQGVFENNEMVDYVARKIADPAEVKKSKQFPFDFFKAYTFCDALVPQKLRAALSAAADAACANIPELPGPIAIGVDVSSSMNSPATGDRGPGSTSKLTCSQAAALFAAALLKRNPDSYLIPFSDRVYPDFRVDPGDTILSIADRIAKLPSGGTDVSLPIQVMLMGNTKPVAGAVILSDNESWIGQGTTTVAGYPHYQGRRTTTKLMEFWVRFLAKQTRSKFPNPKLVCYDLQCYGTTQAPERTDVLNLGGFGDISFTLVPEFFAGTLDLNNRFTAIVDRIEI